jgi:hypothetical protein
MARLLEGERIDTHSGHRLADREDRANKAFLGAAFSIGPTYSGS